MFSIKLELPRNAEEALVAYDQSSQFVIGLSLYGAIHTVVNSFHRTLAMFNAMDRLVSSLALLGDINTGRMFLDRHARDVAMLEHYHRGVFQNILLGADVDEELPFSELTRRASNSLMFFVLELTIRRSDDVGLEGLRTVLNMGGAERIRGLTWNYDGQQSVTDIAMLVAKRCPRLHMFKLNFKYASAMDFVSTAMEHHGSNEHAPSFHVVLVSNPHGDARRFFQALAQFRFSRLHLEQQQHPQQNEDQAYMYHFFNYLTCIIITLTSFSVLYSKPIHVQSILTLLRDCTALKTLHIANCDLSELACFPIIPSSVTKLKLCNCVLFKLNAQERNVWDAQFGAMLLPCLSNVHELELDHLDFSSKQLAPILWACASGANKLKHLDAKLDYIASLSIQALAIALKSPHCELRTVTLTALGGEHNTTNVLRDFLIPALRHSKLDLLVLHRDTMDELNIAAINELHLEMGRIVSRRILFALLHAQQRRRNAKHHLSRLPVEMLRLVGEILF